MHRIVGYMFLNIYIKNSQEFLSSVKRDAHKRKLVLFSASENVTTFRLSSVQMWVYMHA